MSDERQGQVTSLGWLLHAVGLLSVSVCACAYYFLFLGSLESGRRDLERRIGKVTRLMKTAGAIRREHSEVKALCASKQKQATDVRRRIPDEPDEAEFLRLISEAAGKANVVINDYTRGQVTPSSECSQLDIHLQCAGSFAGLCQFLDQVDKLPRVSEIVSLHLTSEKERDRYPLDLTIRLYFGVRANNTARLQTASRGRYG